MKAWILSHAISLALPLIIGALAFAATNWLKATLVAVDRAAPQTKQAIVVALSFVLAGIVKYFGGALPPVCILGDDPLTCVRSLTDVSAMTVLLSAIVAHVIHIGQSK